MENSIKLVNQEQTNHYKVVFEGKKYLIRMSASDLSLGVKEVKVFEEDGVTEIDENTDLYWDICGLLEEI